VAAQSDVEVQYADLVAAYDDLTAVRKSPVKVRRALTRFIDLTQELTAAMRREYDARTGLVWQACTFPRWSPVTELFKYLRTIGQHEPPIRIQVEETQCFRPFPESHELVCVAGTWALDDQLAETPPEGLQVVPADPRTGRPTDQVIPPETREFTFVLYPSNPKLSELLAAVDTRDIHELAARCMQTLVDYLGFYRESLATRVTGGPSA
jgi:hypothetical protein